MNLNGNSIPEPKEGDLLHGFRVTRARQSDELNGTLYEMTFEKTGTELCWLANGAENMLFGIAFLTTPEDDTGVFHILEHSVLCGSERYPVREPFVDLLKSSMNTFLNALTYPDKTFYPVSSRNSRDFLNLTGVYLDAVFAPKILTEKNIFLQEGWHLEDGAFNGVVFNEMKGAMSSVENIASRGFKKLLFPDNCYGFNSGGDPAAIPSLTHERFLDTYRRYYHPSNARIYLDGGIPAEQTFALLEEYLSRFERGTKIAPPSLQTPKPRRSVNYYEPGADEPAENRGQLTFGKILCECTDVVKLGAVDVLCDALAGTNEAPLKRALLSSGLAQDMEMDLSDGIRQPYLEIAVQNCADGKADEIIRLLCGTARKLASEGLDREMLDASFQSAVFNWRDVPEPAGLERGGDALDCWLYGADPMTSMLLDPTVAAIGKMIDDGGFDRLLLELLGDPDTLTVLETLPSASLAAERAEAEAAQARAVTEALPEAGRKALPAQLEALRAWQSEPDSPEAAATIPLLDLSEVSAEPSETPTVPADCGGLTCMFHKLPANGIVHLGLYFSLEACTPEELTLVSLLSGCLGALPTEHYSAAALQREFRRTVGRMDVLTEVYGSPEKDACLPVLTVQCSVLREKLPQALELIAELLLRTRFDDTDKIREQLLQDYDICRRGAVSSGHILAIRAALAGVSAGNACQELFTGGTALRRLRRLTEHFDEEAGAVTRTVQAVLRRTFTRSGLKAGVTAEAPADLTPLLRALPEGTPCRFFSRPAADVPGKSAYRIPASVGYAVCGAAIPGGRDAYSGSLRVAANIATLDCLWNRIRVKGGAYGAGFTVKRSGVMTAYSYRDPNPAASLRAFSGIADSLRSFCASGERIDKYIISTMAGADPLNTPAAAGFRADRDLLNGETREDLCREWRQMLHTSREDLLAAADLLDCLADARLCVTAGESALGACPELTVLDY